MLKSTFSGLQRCHWQYMSILICLAVVASQICKIPREFELQVHKQKDSFTVFCETTCLAAERTELKCSTQARNVLVFVDTLALH